MLRNCIVLCRVYNSLQCFLLQYNLVNSVQWTAVLNTNTYWATATWHTALEQSVLEHSQSTTVHYTSLDYTALCFRSIVAVHSFRLYLCSVKYIVHCTTQHCTAQFTIILPYTAHFTTPVTMLYTSTCPSLHYWVPPAMDWTTTLNASSEQQAAGPL